MVASLRQTSQRQADQSSALLIKLVAALWNLWSSASPDDWWDDSFTWGRSARSAVLVDTALQQARRQARSYASTNLLLLDAKPSSLPAVEDIYPRFDTTALDVYVRPATEYRWQWVNATGDEDAARDAAERRLNALAESDLMTAQRRVEADTYAASSKAVGYRRIFHPELSESGSCGLCIVAATQFYTLSELMPLHPGCHCTTAPITRSSDPGLTLNADELKGIYAQAGSTYAEDLRTIQYRVTENGELGPVLRRDGQHVRTASDAGHKPYRKPTVQDQTALWQRQADLAQTWVTQLEKAIDSDSSSTFEFEGREYTVSPNSQALTYQRALLARMTSKLRSAAA